MPEQQLMERCINECFFSEQEVVRAGDRSPTVRCFDLIATARCSL